MREEEISMTGPAQIQRVVTSGTFSLDGGTWDVDNNIWLVGDDNDVIVFDAAHTAAPIVDAVAGRNVVAVICTHGHNDHITVAPDLAVALDAPCCCTPLTTCCGETSTRTRSSVPSRTAWCSRRARSRCMPCTPPGTRRVRCAGRSPN